MFCIMDQNEEIGNIIKYLFIAILCTMTSCCIIFVILQVMYLSHEVFLIEYEQN